MYSLFLKAEDHATPVEALLSRPDKAWALYVMAHGAGAGMRHEFMEDMARRLALRGVATLRFQFPYMQAGRRRPDAESLLLRTVRAALDWAAAEAADLPLFAGGKSMGGRMTSRLLAQSPSWPTLRGLVFLGFPLHSAERPGTARADHLDQVPGPLLFLQGSRDRLASLPLLDGVLVRLGPRAVLEVVEGADHGFAVPRRQGPSEDEVREGMAEVVAGFCRPLAHP